jgi:hypothetical protein
MRIALAGMVMMCLAVSGLSHARGDVERPPTSLKDASMLGIHRMTVDELKSFIPGTIIRTGPSGRQYTMTFKASSLVLKRNEKGGTERGWWRFDAGRQVYCDSFRGSTGSESGCYAVFQSNDGARFFDYNINSKHYVHTWWKANEGR